MYNPNILTPFKIGFAYYSYSVAVNDIGKSRRNFRQTVKKLRNKKEFGKKT